MSEFLAMIVEKRAASVAHNSCCAGFAMPRRKPPPPDLQRESNHREEREARIREIMERAERHQRLADEHLEEAKRLKATRNPKPRKRR